MALISVVFNYLIHTGVHKNRLYHVVTSSRLSNYPKTRYNNDIYRYREMLSDLYIGIEELWPHCPGPVLLSIWYRHTHTHTHLLNHGLQPPRWTHEGDGCDDFGMEHSKSPVLNTRGVGNVNPSSSPSASHDTLDAHRMHRPGT